MDTSNQPDEVSALADDVLLGAKASPSTSPRSASPSMRPMSITCIA